MISKAQIQYVRSLELKKFRDDSGCFIAEGDKLVREALSIPAESHFRIKIIFATDFWLNQVKSIKDHPDIELVEVSESELDRISLQKTPNQALAIIHRDQSVLPQFDTEKNLLIGLNQVQDPGNVGTIIRLADWFGLDGVIASPDSADFFSPKVVQSSMGSIFRVKLLNADLMDFIGSLKPGFPVYGTHMQGKNLYTSELKDHGLILLGNESRGLSAELMKSTTESLLIPDFSEGRYKPESLNVSIAAAIVCSEFRRRGNG